MSMMGSFLIGIENFEDIITCYIAPIGVSVWRYILIG